VKPPEETSPTGPGSGKPHSKPPSVGPLTDEQRERFDRLVQDVIDTLPARVREMVDQVPIVVIDRPDAAMVRQLVQDGLLEPGEDGSDLCGLHSGTPLTERGVADSAGWGGLGEAGEPETVYLFREGIASLAFASEQQGGFEGACEGDWGDSDADERLYEEIRITVLHEIGHHFGLDEDDLDELGYA
jgi:predicted Zn-dependent protease with MMP-like domain